MDRSTHPTTGTSYVCYHKYQENVLIFSAGKARPIVSIDPERRRFNGPCGPRTIVCNMISSSSQVEDPCCDRSNTAARIQRTSCHGEEQGARGLAPSTVGVAT